MLKYFQDLDYEPRVLTREAYNFYEMLNRVTLDKERSFLNKVQEAIQEKRIPVLRQYYENILRICLFVLSKSSLAIEGYEQGIRLPCFLMNMSDVFEGYWKETRDPDHGWFASLS
jgi:5-methylcytosine-specific restriction endonuclease McrBC regulatory subunit McrC